MDQLKLVNKVGPWVEGEDFWDRIGETTRLAELLEEGHHILLVAPRRVGKTSLLREVLRRLEGKTLGLFLDLQGCSSPVDVVVSLAIALKNHPRLWNEVMALYRHSFGEETPAAPHLGSDVIELKIREGTVDAWRQKGDRLFELLADAGLPVIVCLDELPILVSRLILGRDRRISEAGTRIAEEFLLWLRRACGTHQGRIRFVVCGSIGLEPVVARVGLSHTIGHLRTFILDPWPRGIARECLEALATNYDLILPASIIESMLDRLRWYVPHHVQMYFGHLLDDCRRRGSWAVEEEDARRVYERTLLGARGHAVLADYEERLLRVLAEPLVPAALEFLTEAAVAGILTQDAMLSISKGATDAAGDEHDRARAVLEVLMHDGYLQETQDGAGYVFVSGLIEDWWRRRFGRGYERADTREVTQ